MAASGINDPYSGRSPTGTVPTYGIKKREDANSPYRGGLMTNFDWLKNVDTVNAGGKYDLGMANQALNQTGQMDRDVQGAMAAYNERLHPLAGTNSAEQAALYDMYSSRINQKNALAEQIASAEGQGKRNAISDIYGEASRALGQGLKHTNENFNSRGLLYSGLRQGAEEKVKAGVGAKMASDIAGTNREMANVAAKSKAAYAAVGLQNQQQMIDLANQTFETASRNNIARLQAYQQFGQGLGYAAGSIYGGQAKKDDAPKDFSSTGSGAETANINWGGNSGSGSQGLVGPRD